MIIDNIKNAAIYSDFNPGIGSALDYLSRTDITALTPGRQDINGDRLFVLIQRYETKPREQGVWEAHRRYIDVQFVAAGCEAMGYAPLTGLTVTQPYAPDKDCVLLAGSGDFFTAKAGVFVVFFPEDAHMPGLALGTSSPVVKAVVKVAID